MIYHIFPTPPLGQDMTLGQLFKQSLTGLNLEFSFYTSCLTKTEEPSLPYYFPIAGGIITGFIPFPRVLVLCEMQSVLSSIWTRVAMSISYDDNQYTTSTFKVYDLLSVFDINRFTSWLLMTVNVTSHFVSWM